MRLRMESRRSLRCLGGVSSHFSREVHSGVGPWGPKRGGGRRCGHEGPGKARRTSKADGGYTAGNLQREAGRAHALVGPSLVTFLVAGEP